MNLNLKKKSLKNLSSDAAILPAEMTPQVAGGAFTDQPGCGKNGGESFHGCNSDQFCNNSGFDDCDGISWTCGYSGNCVGTA